MADETERRIIEQLAAQLDEAVNRAREASHKADTIRQEIAHLMAKAERLQREIRDSKKSQSDKSPNSN